MASPLCRVLHSLTGRRVSPFSRPFVRVRKQSFGLLRKPPHMSLVFDLELKGLRALQLHPGFVDSLSNPSDCCENRRTGASPRLTPRRGSPIFDLELKGLRALQHHLGFVDGLRCLDSLRRRLSFLHILEQHPTLTFHCWFCAWHIIYKAKECWFHERFSG